LGNNNVPAKDPVGNHKVGSTRFVTGHYVFGFWARVDPVVE
jgi:hypothetical protein